MTIRFSPARNRIRIRPSNAGWGGPSISLLAANDNGFDAANDDTMLTEALRYFAEHGMCAAERARDKAYDAHLAGDSETFDWWLSVCRTLDRRMAEAVAARAAFAT